MIASRGNTVALCQRQVKGCGRIFFDPFDGTAKLGIGIGSINIGDGKRNMGITFDILILLSIYSRGEFDKFTIPLKSHG